MSHLWHEQTWPEIGELVASSMNAFKADPFIEEVLGTGLRDEFIRYKRAEWEEYHQTISAWEVERYSHMF